MLQRTAERLTRMASWPRVLVLLVLYIALVSILNAAEGRIKAISGGLGVPDLMQFFSASDLYSRLQAFGAEGRSIYLKAELVDLVYPLVYTALLGSIIALAIRRRFGEQSRLLLICFVPIVGMLSDYLENTGIFIALSSFPDEAKAAAGFAATFNGAKWIGFGVTMLLVAVSLLDTIVHLIQRTLGARTS